MDDNSHQLGSVIGRLRRLGTDSTTVEVKAAAGGLPKSLGESVSAFANGSGGTIVLGLAESDDFRPAPGFAATRIRDGLARLCHDDLEPPVRADVDIVEFEGAQTVVLEVPALDPLRRPCHIKRLGPYEGSFVRGGDGDRRLTAYEVTQMLSNRAQPKDDAEVVAGATLEHLDEGLTSALLQRLRRRPGRAFNEVDDTTALVRAGVAADDGHGIFRPTLAGLLCLGKYPQEFFPQLFVSFVALPGHDLGEALDDGTRFLDNISCDGTLPEILAGVLTAARRNMRTAAVIRGGGREDRHDYPTEVIRELVVNALLHRDYSPLSRGTQVQVELYPDRLVVKSPGGLWGAVVPSQLGVEAVSSTRNTVLAKLLADVPDADGLPVSENRGSGLPRVMTRLRRAGMSPPAFDAAPGHLHVTVPQHALLDPDAIRWIAGLGQAGLSDDQHIALALMRAGGTVSNEMLRAWGTESHAATLALRDLVDRGLAVKFGGRRYATYELGASAVRSSGESLRPAGSVGRSRRIESELQSVVEAIRAGYRTSAAIGDQLGLSYATVTRRINRLLELGRIRATAPPHSRSRTFVVPD